MTRRHQWTINHMLDEPDVHTLWVCSRCRCRRRWERVKGKLIEVYETATVRREVIEGRPTLACVR
jgi:hypothetical protein